MANLIVRSTHPIIVVVVESPRCILVLYGVRMTKLFITLELATLVVLGTTITHL